MGRIGPYPVRSKPLSTIYLPSDGTALAPSYPNQISTLPSVANVLHVSVATFNGEMPSQLLLASTADKKLHLITTDTTFGIYRSLSCLQDSPILSCVSFGNQGLRTITTGMSGQVVLYVRYPFGANVSLIQPLSES